MGYVPFPGVGNTKTFDIGFPSHFGHLFIQFHQFSIQFHPKKLTAFKSKVQFRQIVIHIRFLSIKFNNSAFKFVNCHWNSSLSLSELRMQGSNSSFFQTNSSFCHSNSSGVIGPLHLGDDFDWNVDENERQQTKLILLSRAKLLWPTNLNSSWRKRVTKHEIEWQCFKIDRPKPKLKRACAHTRGSGTKLKTHFLILNEEMTKMGGNTYVYSVVILLFRRRFYQMIILKLEIRMGRIAASLFKIFFIIVSWTLTPTSTGHYTSMAFPF